MQNATAVGVIAIAVVLLARALVGHRYRRRRKISVTIEWGDGFTGAQKPPAPTPEGQDGGLDEG